MLHPRVFGKLRGRTVRGGGAEGLAADRRMASFLRQANRAFSDKIAGPPALRYGKEKVYRLQVNPESQAIEKVGLGTAGRSFAPLPPAVFFSRVHRPADPLPQFSYRRFNVFLA